MVNVNDPGRCANTNAGVSLTQIESEGFDPMAAVHSSADPCAPTHPMAKAGYGKRLAPYQLPAHHADFVHLPKREAFIAEFIDGLPVGAAIGYKVLAEELADYGQQAVRSSLDRLTREGHLRRIKVHVTCEDGGRRWVTRTYFSRHARDAAWWEDFVRSVRGVDVPGQPPAPDSVPGAEPAPAAAATPATPAPEPEATDAAPEATPRPRSAAYELLAALGRTEPRLQLSEAECGQLEALAAEWLARGMSPGRAARTLADRLPTVVHHAAAFVRQRLENKMPPKPKKAFVPQELDAVMMCAFCDEDETTTRLVDGVCVDCRADIDADEARGATGDVPDTFLARPRGSDVTAQVAAVRAAGGLPVGRR